MLGNHKHPAKWTCHLLAGSAALATTLLASEARGQAAYQAEYLGDVGHTDGEAHPPGASFEWTWNIRNAGTESWDGEDVRLKPYGEQVLAEVSESEAINLEPGDSEMVTVSGLVAPTAAGLHRQYWHIYRGDVDFTQNLGFWVEINVEGDGAPDAELVGGDDVTTSACAVAGQPTTKTWNVRNSGGTTWTPANTKLVHIRGPRHGAEQEIPISSTVTPGQTTSIAMSINPSGTESPGVSVWQLQGPGPGGETSLFGPELNLSLDVQESCNAGGVCEPGQTRSCCNDEGEQTCNSNGSWTQCSASCSGDDIGTGAGDVMPAGCGCRASGSEAATWWLLAALWLGARRRRRLLL